MSEIFGSTTTTPLNPNSFSGGGNVDNEYLNNNFANSLKGTKCGKEMEITDLSPFEHELSVKLDAPNFFKMNVPEYEHSYSGATITIDPNGNKVRFVCDGTNTDDEGSITNLRTGEEALEEHIKVDRYLTVFATSNDGNDIPYANVGVHLSNGEYLCTSFNEPKLIPSGCAICDVYFALLDLTFVYDITVQPMLSAFKPTEYVAPEENPNFEGVTISVCDAEGNKKTYTADSDGIINGIKSSYPTTTLKVETGSACIVAEYNRDTNKAFNELLSVYNSINNILATVVDVEEE